MPHSTGVDCSTCPIRELDAFCSIPEEARAFLKANSISMEYSRGSAMFRQGDSCDAVFVLCSGRVKISATSREGRTMILRIAEPGSVLGMSAALSNEPHELSAEALERCHVRVLSSRMLATLLRNYPEAAVAAAKSVAADYRAAFEGTRRIALPATPAGRVACLLLDWLRTQKGSQRGDTFTMSLTHDELASMTATTRETVTRTLSRFKRDGIIQTRGVALTIMRPAALQQLSAC